MKKCILILISIFTIGINLWAIWEGNGIAGTATDFKEDGMFVKTSIVPKYSLIEITNLENDITVRSIVLEGNEEQGILMTFSPSVAEALKVKYGQVTRIRVSSPSLVEEDNKSSSLAKLPKDEKEEEEKKEAQIDAKDKKEVPPIAREALKEEEKDDEVLLYDFKPVAKSTKTMGKKGGQVSFNPSFIEEDVKLNLNIPKEIIKDEPKGKEGELKIKSSTTTTKTYGEPTPSPITPPKTISTPKKRSVYLEKVALRPPKEVAIPKLEEKKAKDSATSKVPSTSLATKEKEKTPAVKDVVMIEKPKEKEKTVLLAVGEVEGIKEKKEVPIETKINPPMEVKSTKEMALKNATEEKKDIKSVSEVEGIKEKKEEANKNKVEDVKNAPLIMEPLKEEVKEDDKNVNEVGIPTNKEKNETKTILDVMEVSQVTHSNVDDEEKPIAPVSEVSIPKEPNKSEDESLKEDVSVVENIKEKEVEEKPIEEEELKEEEKPIDEPIAELVKEEDAPKEIEEENKDLEENVTPSENEGEENNDEENNSSSEVPIEEMPKEESLKEEASTKELDEKALKEIEVKKPKDNEVNKNIVALEDEKVKNDNSKLNNDMNGKALNEIKIIKINNKKAPFDEDINKEEVNVSSQKEETNTPSQEIQDNNNQEMDKPKTNEENKDDTETQPEKVEENKEDEKEKEEEIKPIEEPKEMPKQPPLEEKDVNNAKPLPPPRKENKKEEKKHKTRFDIGKTVWGYSYVQIAVYESELSVEEVLKQYGNKYPIIVEKRGSNKYVVFVGPLKKDETGAVQNIFKNFGFKDCFIKTR